MDAILNLEKKPFLLMSSGVVLLFITASISYVIWPQFKDLKSGIHERNELSKLTSSKSQLDEQNSKLIQELEQIKRNLRGDMADLPEKKMESFIIGKLQNISWGNDINLIGVKPVQGNEIQMFQEILFNVQLAGEYFDLYKWLNDLREQLGFIVVKNLELDLVDTSRDNPKLLMKLTIASYKRIKNET